MKKIYFFILSFLVISLCTFLIRTIDRTVLAQGTQKQGTLQFPTIEPTTPTPPQSTEITKGTQQVDWVFDNLGRCWNAWSAPSCGLQQHEGGVTVPSMRDLDQDGLEDITCSQGGTSNGTTITNTSNKPITINCEQYTCMACATGNGIHAQCDGGTDKNSKRVVKTVLLTPGCVATCTMAGVFGSCLEQKAPPEPTSIPNTIISTKTSPTSVPTKLPTATKQPQPTTQQNTPTTLPIGKQLPVAIDYGSYAESYNKYPPTYVYAMLNRSYDAQSTSRGIAGLVNIKGTVTKMIMVSEYNALEQILQNHGDAIKAAGITWIGYNAERDGRTPENELTNMFSTNPSTNTINKFGRLVHQYGLKLMLGPTTPMWEEYFNRADKEAGEKAMMGDGCYLDGVAFQEQKQIGNNNKDERTQIIGERTAFFRKNAPNCPQFESMVQLMSSWCTQNASWEECKGYYNLLKGLTGQERINSLAIWASGDERNDLQKFIDFLRN